jgi:1,4-alpha-glucan branching enzyme
MIGLPADVVRGDILVGLQKDFEIFPRLHRRRAEHADPEEGNDMLSQDNISSTTPTGATVLPGGATFRVWAPRARAVYLNGIFAGEVRDQQSEDRLLRKDASGYWTGFEPGAQDRDRYRFWVTGEGSNGNKRDPYAREIDPIGFPNSFCILRAADAYPWHDAGFLAPDFSDMIVYQLHVGSFAIARSGVASNFLDVN